MINWKETEPDYRIHSLQDMFNDFGLIDGLRLITSTEKELIVILSYFAKKKIHKHLIQNRNELGGLLLGKVYKINRLVGIRYVTVVHNSVPSIEFVATPISISIGTDVWDFAHKYKKQDYDVVGWYHSHPGIGAFFSSTDRNTQSHFFKEPFQLGYVEDPYRREYMWFCGGDSHRVNVISNTIQ